MLRICAGEENMSLVRDCCGHLLPVQGGRMLLGQEVLSEGKSEEQ